MVKNQAKIPHFRQWYFDKKAAPELTGTACAAYTATIGLMFENYKLAVFNFLGVFTSTVCAFPSRVKVTFTDDLSFESRAASTS